MRLYKIQLIKLIAFIIAFQVLNMSIDSSNARPDNLYTSGGSFNHIDTYIEFVAEVILKYENAIPESGKTPQKQWQQHKLYTVTCDNTRPAHGGVVYYMGPEEIFIDEHNKYAYQFIKEICPPPKFSC